MKRENEKKWKKLLSYILVFTMCFGVVNIPVYAMGSSCVDGSMEIISEDVEEVLAVKESVSSNDLNEIIEKENSREETIIESTWDQVTTEKVYESENYKVIFTLTSSWDTGYNAKIKLENIGDSTIQNWCLGFNFNNSITNIWNAKILSNEGEYIIKNVGWNQDIAVGNNIEFGISGEHEFRGFPEKYELIGTSSKAAEEDYSIHYNVNSDWGNGFYGSISLTNNTTTDLEEWVLEFDFDRKITEIWNGIIEEHNDGHYVVRNAKYNSTISPGESVLIGIKGCEGDVGEEPEECVLYSYGMGDKKVEIVINKNYLRKDEKFDYYYITDDTCGIEGTLSNSYQVERMFYEVKDCSDNIVECGDISISEFRNASNMKFTIGANFITIKAILNSGKEIEKEIIIFNNRMDNLSSQLDFSDIDGDNLPNFVEQFFGTDCYNEDTDGDNLSDYDELYILGSNPILKDTDGNSIEDMYEDYDEDGLVSIKEIEQKTDPFLQDTDGDGLLDGDEVNVYNTNPNNKDTDKDEVCDGIEIKIGTNPLISESNFDVTVTAQEKDTVNVSVTTSLLGSQVESLSVCKYENDFLFPEVMPGYIGGVYDFYVEGIISSATLKFEFDESLLEDKNFDPIIYYYNEDEQQLEALSTIVEGNVATTTVNHFSKYVLLNRTIYEESFEWQDVWSNEEYDEVEIVLVIDDSGSLGGDYGYNVTEGIFYGGMDPEHKRLEVARNFVDNANSSAKIGIVKFDGVIDNISNGLIECNQTGKEKLKDYLKFTYSSGGSYNKHGVFDSRGSTNMYSGIESAMKHFSNDSKNTLKVLIVFTDGNAHDINKHSTVIKAASDNGIKIYTVGLGNSTSYFTKYLKPLAQSTGGTFYHASNANELATIYDEINEKIDIETDSDGDGITDYYEDNMVIFNGLTISLDKEDPDVDKDGLLDGEEIVDLNYKYNSDKTKVIVTGKILSNPLNQDSDQDGLLDADDPEPYKHFGLFNNNIDFKLTNSVKVPYNSAIESAKQVTIQDYNRIWRDRAANTIDNEYLEALYILNIQSRAYMLLGAAYMGDGALILAGELLGKKIDINDGCYFLAYYLSCLGGYVEYDGTYPAVGDSNGLEKYNNYVNKLLDVCESGTSKGKTITFTQIDAACGDTSINYNADNFETLNYWLAVKGGHIGMAGECSYDGLYYNLDLIYCIQDYYDFYYENPKGGQDSVGLVNNDEMAFLKLFGAAENFENCGIYHVNIRWEKGQTLSQANQTPLNYSYVGK